MAHKILVNTLHRWRSCPVPLHNSFLSQLFQQVFVKNRRQSLYLVTHHEQRSDALDFCTSSFSTQVVQRAVFSRFYVTLSQLEMRYCLRKLLSTGNPSGPVKVWHIDPTNVSLNSIQYLLHY
jgi:hypothetical protein